MRFVVFGSHARLLRSLACGSLLRRLSETIEALGVCCKILFGLAYPPVCNTPPQCSRPFITADTALGRPPERFFGSLLGRRPQRLKPLGDLGFCQVHRLQELDVIGTASLEIRVLEAERKEDHQATPHQGLRF